MTETVEVGACPACGKRAPRVLAPPADRRVFVTDGPEMSARIGVCACASCGLIFLSPRLSAASLAEYYARQSRMPRAAIRADSPIARMLDAQLDFILARKPLDPSASALEIGCAEGYLLERLAMRIPGLNVAGIEPSARYAHAARERLPHAKVVQEVLHEGLLDVVGTFDLIVMRHVLEHLTEPVKDLGLVRRLLRPGGAVYIEVPDVATTTPAVCHYFHHEHLTYFSAETLAASLARAGLRALTLERYPGYEHGSGFSYPVLRVIARAGVSTAPLDHPDQPDRLWRQFRTSEETFLRTYLDPAKARLDAAARQGRRLALFGAGPHTVDVLDRLAPSRYSWVVIFDNHPAKAGKRLCGIPIAKPTADSVKAVDTVFVSSLEYEREMIDQLEALGGDRLEIVPLYTATVDG